MLGLVLTATAASTQILTTTAPADVAAPPADAMKTPSGLASKVLGETRRLWIPENLAYRGVREPKGMLVFDVQLLEIQ